MYPLDDVLIKPWALLSTEEVQTGRNPIAKQADSTSSKPGGKPGIVANKYIRFPGGDISRTPVNPKNVFVNPYSTPDQLTEVSDVNRGQMVSGLSAVYIAGNVPVPSTNLYPNNNAGNIELPNDPPGKYYDPKLLTQTQVNNKHSGFGQRQEKFRSPKSPVSYGFRNALHGLNAMTIEPTNNPTRKQFVQHYTPPLQAFRVMIQGYNQPSGQQTPIGSVPSQPSVIFAGPQHPIVTSMPFQSGSSGKF
jgi:hypothetical protein